MADINFMPLGDGVLLKPILKKEITTASGLVIPVTNEKDSPEEGLVVAVGPGRFDDGVLVPMTVKVGDKVLFRSGYGLEKVHINGEQYIVATEGSILGISK